MLLLHCLRLRRDYVVGTSSRALDESLRCGGPLAEAHIALNKGPASASDARRSWKSWKQRHPVLAQRTRRPV